MDRTLGIVLSAARDLTHYGAINAETLAAYTRLTITDTQHAIEALRKQRALNINEYGDVLRVNPNL